MPDGAEISIDGSTGAIYFGLLPLGLRCETAAFDHLVELAAARGACPVKEVGAWPVESSSVVVTVADDLDGVADDAAIVIRPRDAEAFVRIIGRMAGRSGPATLYVEEHWVRDVRSLPAFAWAEVYTDHACRGAAHLLAAAPTVLR